MGEKARDVFDKILTNRIKGDIRLMENNPELNIDYILDESNMLIWYFLIHGDETTPYAGGEYIGVIKHGQDYPFAPPEFRVLTPSGRFVPDKAICLSNSSFHPEEWSPNWNVLGILQAFVSVMLDDEENGISHVVESEETRKHLAKQSIAWNQTHKPDLYALLLERQAVRLAKLKKNDKSESDKAPESMSVTDSEESGESDGSDIEDDSDPEDAPILSEEINLDVLSVSHKNHIDESPHKDEDSEIELDDEGNVISKNKFAVEDFSDSEAPMSDVGSFEGSEFSAGEFSSDSEDKELLLIDVIDPLRLSTHFYSSVDKEYLKLISKMKITFV
jgi:ubiquitin-conjugating enzyme E2 J2